MGRHFLGLPGDQSVKNLRAVLEWGGRREEGSGWGTHVYLKTHLAAKWNVKFEGELHSQLQTCHHTILVSKNLSFHV